MPQSKEYLVYPAADSDLSPSLERTIKTKT